MAFLFSHSVCSSVSGHMASESHPLLVPLFQVENLRGLVNEKPSTRGIPMQPLPGSEIVHTCSVSRGDRNEQRKACPCLSSYSRGLAFSNQRRASQEMYSKIFPCGLSASPLSGCFLTCYGLSISLLFF